MIKKLSVALVILLLSISVSNADYVKDLEDTVLKQEKIIVSQHDKINDLENKLDVKEAKDEYLFRIPFTGLGIKTSFARGFVVGYIICII